MFGSVIMVKTYIKVVKRKGKQEGQSVQNTLIFTQDLKVKMTGKDLSGERDFYISHVHLITKTSGCMTPQSHTGGPHFKV